MQAPTDTRPEAPPAPARRRSGHAVRLRTLLTTPVVVLGIGTAVVLTVLVVLPLAGLVSTTLDEENIESWSDVLTSRLSENLFWTPLANSLLIGTLTAIGSVLIGGYLAWLVVMTNVRFRKTIGLLATIPFALPSFALALGWETVFRNDLIGGRVGILQDLGVDVPDWLSWGAVPIAATLVAHYYSLSFLLIAAALASVNGDLMEAGQMAGASSARVAWSIALPVVTPAIIASALLAFAEGVSNFVSPALLGLPVRFQTLSTRLYGSISTGDTARGYVIAILLILVAALVMFASTRVTGKRKSFATITGKGSRRTLLSLGRKGTVLTALALVIVTATSILPGVVLLLTSFTRRTNSLLGGFTTHYWVGESSPDIAQGQRGILLDPQMLDATVTTILLGVCVAVGASAVGLAIGYVVTRLKNAPLVTGSLSVLSYLPFLVPGIALGVSFIALFGRPIGPFPALYGTFAILVIAGIAATLPFAAQTGRGAVSQISSDVEEAAVMSGAGLARRIGSIIAPLASRGIIAGAVLVFVQMVRDLSLVVLLATPATPLLSTRTFQYASEGFTQFANAVTIVIALISVVATVLARRLQGKSQPWMES